MGKYAYNVYALRMQSILILGLLCAKGTYGTTAGAPDNTCSEMNPTGHFAQPQTTDPPYVLNFDKKAINRREAVEVTIKGKTGTDKFRGFLIVARKQGGDDKVAIGTWSDGEHSKTITCSDVTGMAVTHTNGSIDKPNVKVIWIPDGPGKYDMFFTVVKKMDTYWVKKQTPGFEFIEVTPFVIKNSTQAASKTPGSAADSLRISQLLVGSLSTLTLLVVTSHVNPLSISK